MSYKQIEVIKALPHEQQLEVTIKGTYTTLLNKPLKFNKDKKLVKIPPLVRAKVVGGVKAYLDMFMKNNCGIVQFKSKWKSGATHGVVIGASYSQKTSKNRSKAAFTSFEENGDIHNIYLHLSVVTTEGDVSTVSVNQVNPCEYLSKTLMHFQRLVKKVERPPSPAALAKYRKENPTT